MFPLKLHVKPLLLLFLGFVLATIVGTLSHELGHWAVAKYFGYDARIAYGYMDSDPKEKDDYVQKTYLEYCEEIRAGDDFPGKEKFYTTWEKLAQNGFYIILGGPAQTMLFGTLGFFLLLGQRKKIRKAKKLGIDQWLLVFLCLFWLREPANFLTGCLGYALKGKHDFYSDEVGLASYLGWPFWSILGIAAVFGIAILAFVVFKIVPPRQRLTFLVAGLLGGVFGYLFWLEWVGPVLLP
jgi:hypothetical protein